MSVTPKCISNLVNIAPVVTLSKHISEIPCLSCRLSCLLQQSFLFPEVYKETNIFWLAAGFFVVWKFLQLPPAATYCNTFPSVTHSPFVKVYQTFSIGWLQAFLWCGSSCTCRQLPPLPTWRLLAKPFAAHPGALSKWLAAQRYMLTGTASGTTVNWSMTLYWSNGHAWPNDLCLNE